MVFGCHCPRRQSQDPAAAIYVNMLFPQVVNKRFGINAAGQLHHHRPTALRLWPRCRKRQTRIIRSSYDHSCEVAILRQKIGLSCMPPKRGN